MHALTIICLCKKNVTYPFWVLYTVMKLKKFKTITFQLHLLFLYPFDEKSYINYWLRLIKFRKNAAWIQEKCVIKDTSIQYIISNAWCMRQVRLRKFMLFISLVVFSAFIHSFGMECYYYTFLLGSYLHVLSIVEFEIGSNPYLHIIRKFKKIHYFVLSSTFIQVCK